MNDTEKTTIETAAPTGSERKEGGPAAQVLLGAASQAAPLLMGVKLPIRILLGRTEISLKDLAQLASGSVVELDCSPDDPVEILVHDRVIARGEVVVVAGNYGVRITKIASQQGRDELESQGNDLLNLSERLK